MTAFTAGSQDLAAVVLRAARFVPEELGRWLPPVCKGILLAAQTDEHGGGVEIVATDLEGTGRGRVVADVTAPGRVLLSGARLARIARHLPAPDVTVALDGTVAVITSGPARWRLLTMPAEDFPVELPAAPDLDTVKPVAMDGHQLELAHGQAFVRRVRPRRVVRPPRVKDLYSPTGLDVGAWITWSRRTDDGEEVVSGQVWSLAPGAHAVWALAEGETTPAYVQPRYGVGRGRRPDLTRLIEATPPAVPHH